MQKGPRQGIPRSHVNYQNMPLSHDSVAEKWPCPLSILFLRDTHVTCRYSCYPSFQVTKGPMSHVKCKNRSCGRVTSSGLDPIQKALYAYTYCPFCSDLRPFHVGSGVTKLRNTVTFKWRPLYVFYEMV